MIITLKKACNCFECGAHLPAGFKGNWYPNGNVYGLECHKRTPKAQRVRRNEPLGQTYSRLDRYGVYSHDGTKMGSTCGCEDYPCCGH